MASKAGNETSGGKKSTATRNDAAGRNKVASEGIGVLLIAGGILAAAYLFFSATGYLGEMLGKALFGMIGVIAYALPVILIAVGVIYIRGASNARLNGGGWYLLLSILALVTLFSTIRNALTDGMEYMAYINDALSIGQNAHLGGGFIGAVLSYLLLKLGGPTLSYILCIALLLVCVIKITGFSLRDASEVLTQKVLTAMENSQERASERAIEYESREERPMFTLTLEDEQSKAPGKGKKAALPEAVVPPSTKAKSQRVEAFDKPEIDLFEKPGKSRKLKSSPAKDADLKAFGEQKGEFVTKNGEKARTKKPEKVNADIWDEIDFEPHDDVPLVLAKNGTPIPKPIVQLPDPTPLFGANTHKAAKPVSMEGMPARQPGTKQKPIDKPAAKAPDPLADKKKTQPEVILGDGQYHAPSLELLNHPGEKKDDDSDTPEEKARILIDTLASFRIAATVTNIAVGPALTRIEIQPAAGTRISRITALQNDITMALAAPRLRMEAPIPGKNAIGIEIPNKGSTLVVLRDILESKEFKNSASPVTMAFGREASGKIIVADLTRMPHMLIAGATGSGKSVCINDIIVSMVYKSSPQDVRFILVDPKMVEMTMYGSLPHLLIPVVTDPKKAAGAMRWAVKEMTDRYKTFSEQNARNLDRFNERVEKPENKLPRIVIIIDELADLMMIAPDEVEDSIRRIAQLGRAAGIHLILATQRPDATVITGLIKANIPSRAAFAVSSATNSRIILDMGGAEKLLGHGDMLFHPDGSAKPTRLQCAFVSDEEVERIVAHFRESTARPVFSDQILEDVSSLEKNGATGGVFGEGKQEDDLLGEAVRVVFEHGQASTSMIQRRLRVGYARASRLIDIMEQKGYISGFNGSKAREVLIKRAQLEELFGDGTPLADPPVQEREPNPMSSFYRDDN
ncbi:MAG TPA: DNA translocase FtsK [Clostridia bacterium]|nr:DNA translocase FtsK [Clostridia bacterium]